MKTFRFRGVTAVLVAIAATAGLTLTASVASAATTRPATVKAAVVTPATSCTGSVDAKTTASNGLAQQEFWWTRESATAICVGSVIFTENFTQAPNGYNQRVRIWEEPENFLVASYWDGGTITSTGIRFDNVIRTVQPAPEGKVMVCSAMVTGNGSNDVVGGVPTLCQTVG